MAFIFSCLVSAGTGSSSDSRRVVPDPAAKFRVADANFHIAPGRWDSLVDGSARRLGENHHRLAEDA
jgi:hypothetical protein